MTSTIRTPAIPRIVSIDAMRGATIASMWSVRKPVAGTHVAPDLKLDAWNGGRRAYFVVPFCLVLRG